MPSQRAQPIRTFSAPARSHQKSSSAEKSLPPYAPARAWERLSRAVATIGTGTRDRWASKSPLMRCRFPGPQLAAHTASSPVIAASAPAANAAASSWRTCSQVIEPLRARNTILVERAIQRGEIPADVDPDVILDMMFGAAYHRLLQGHRPLTDQFARRVVDLIVAGVRAS